MTMACDFLLSSSSSLCPRLLSNQSLSEGKKTHPRIYKYRALSISASSNGDTDTTKMVTFLGKGGSGKTTSAVFAAQHYALAGLKTCLLIQSQDKASECLLGQKIGASPIQINDNLSAVRLETTKIFLEPLKKLKEADSRLNITQGVLEGMVGEELGVLPGMDSIFSTFTLARFAGFLRDPSQKNPKDKYDVIVYDGVSTEETLRMVGASSKSRLYLRYLRNMAEKTDIGRLAGPSLMRLVDEAMGISRRSSSPLNGSMSSEIWDSLEQLLERGSSAFKDSTKFSCFLMMDPKSTISVNSALHYWGCTIQAGAQVSGALAISSPNVELSENVGKKFTPLPFALTPDISAGSSIDWKTVIQDGASKYARDILSMSVQDSSLSPVKFDSAKRTVTLLMPGFDKSEIKLFQYRGGSELLVEAGDQRRVINLPVGIQGKVGGAKFVDRSIIITMR